MWLTAYLSFCELNVHNIRKFSSDTLIVIGVKQKTCLLYEIAGVCGGDILNCGRLGHKAVQLHHNMKRRRT